MKNYLVVFEHEGASWSAYAPDLPGCVAAGDSKKAVAELIREAIEFHIEGMREDGIPIPEPSADAEHVSVARNHGWSARKQVKR